MINWNKVVVGETEIVDQYRMERLIVARDKDMIGTKCGNLYRWVHINQTTDWSIYDPFEDVSEECHLEWWGTHSHVLKLFHGATWIRSDDANYKCDGLRVWKRKEE